MSILISVIGGFASGIFFRSLFVFGWPVYLFTLLLAVLCAGAHLRFSRQFNLACMLFFAFACAGMFRTGLAAAPALVSFKTDLKHRVSYEGIVTSDPDVREKNQRITVRVTKGTDATKLLAIVPLTEHVAVGDHVRVWGTLSEPAAFAEESGRVFHYEKYLEVRGVYFLLQYGGIQTEKSAPWYSVPAELARIKHGFLEGLSQALPNPYAALAGGIVIGGKTGLPKEVQDDFIRSGLIQIVVLSGYNVMIVAEWVMTFFLLLNFSNRTSAIAGALGLVTLVGIAGISATAVRAALMALIALYARISGRSYAAGRALLATVFLMIFWNPLYLAFDPGFGLSVTATAGLIWLAPIIEGRLMRITKQFWRNAFATTLAAQIAVLPLLLYDTGTLSLVALPANILTMPVIPLAMACAALAGLAGIFFTFAPLIATIAGFPVLFLTYYLMRAASISAHIPFAAVTLPAFPFIVVILLYGLLSYIASSKRFSTTLQFKFAKNASM